MGRGTNTLQAPQAAEAVGARSGDKRAFSHEQYRYPGVPPHKLKDLWPLQSQTLIALADLERWRAVRIKNSGEAEEKGCGEDEISAVVGTGFGVSHILSYLEAEGLVESGQMEPNQREVWCLSGKGHVLLGSLSPRTVETLRDYC